MGTTQVEQASDQNVGDTGLVFAKEMRQENLAHSVDLQEFYVAEE